VPTLAEFARDRYLPHVRERLRSAANPEAHLRLRILPLLGRKSLDEVNQDDVAALRRKLLAEGRSCPGEWCRRRFWVGRPVHRPPCGSRGAPGARGHGGAARCLRRNNLLWPGG
jgi:hypothetical protein